MFIPRHREPFCALLFIVLAATTASFAIPPATAAEVKLAAAGFFVPSEIPRSRYLIDARFDFKAGTLEGRQTIALKNSSAKPLAVIALGWNINDNQSLDVSVAGVKLAPRREGPMANLSSPVFYELPRPIPTGGSVTLSVEFRRKLEGPAEEGFSASVWYPKLWWDGLPGHDDYSVKVDAPPDFLMAASGRNDARTGRFEADGVRSFGIYLAKGETAETREVDGVLITAVSTPKGKKAAAICLNTAADAVKYYKQWLGFYPYSFLTIVPGGSGRWGGYPFAPGIVAIHGLETYEDGESPQHWQHITSHEIGHQVLERMGPGRRQSGMVMDLHGHPPRHRIHDRPQV